MKITEKKSQSESCVKIIEMITREECTDTTMGNIC